MAAYPCQYRKAPPPAANLGEALSSMDSTMQVCVCQGIVHTILAEFALDVLIEAAGAVTKRRPPGIIKLELMRWRVSPS